MPRNSSLITLDNSSAKADRRGCSVGLGLPQGIAVLGRENVEFPGGLDGLAQQGGLTRLRDGADDALTAAGASSPAGIDAAALPGAAFALALPPLFSTVTCLLASERREPSRASR